MFADIVTLILNYIFGALQIEKTKTGRIILFVFTVTFFALVIGGIVLFNIKK
jgi:hypothetical protein